MINFLTSNWGWKTSGTALAIIFLITVATVKPIGVSTQFVIFDGMVYSLFSDDIVSHENGKATSNNEYLNKSSGKYAKNIMNPLNYSFVFVIAMIVGGFIAFKISQNKEDDQGSDNCVPKVWEASFGSSQTKRNLASFIGGVFVLYGARLAGGCTSGHMMSGMMQTSISGYLFALATFAAAIATSLIIYKKGA